MLDAAGYCEAAARSAWIRSQLQRPLLGGPEALLSMTYANVPEDDKSTVLRFMAQLNRGFYGSCKGDTVQIACHVQPDGMRTLSLSKQQGNWFREVKELVLAADSCSLQP